MSLQQKINFHLNKHPKIKKIIKRVYQLFFYSFSKKIKYEGNIIRVSPNDNKEYFFGYYDKSPWDSSGRYMLCMQADCTWKEESPKKPLNILLLDVFNNYKPTIVATSHSWNVQMGCMAQWLGPTFDKEIIYNDFRDGNYCSIILNVFSKEERVINFPIYSVSSNGSFALSLDFSRLYNLRPGYGYFNVPEKTKNISLPDSTCLWLINIESKEVLPLLKYTDFSNFSPRTSMLDKESVHKINHIMISPNGKRFMVLYRWFIGKRKFTRLITCNVDGTDMYVLSDDDMVSHCFWKNDEYILAFENKKSEGPGYYLMKDKSNEYKHLWKKYSDDGHPSYSPNNKFVVTDCYPSKKRLQTIFLFEEEQENGKIISKVFSPFKYDNEKRCDLHPRWSRNGKYVCFDGCFEGKRGLYIVPVEE